MLGFKGNGCEGGGGKGCSERTRRGDSHLSMCGRELGSTKSGESKTARRREGDIRVCYVSLRVTKFSKEESIARTKNQNWV